MMSVQASLQWHCVQWSRAKRNGASQLTRYNSNTSQPGFVIDPQFGPELLPNRKITGAPLESAQPDEQYDAGDFENWLLAWQPADHREILPSVEAAIRAASPASLPSQANGPKGCSQYRSFIPSTRSHQLSDEHPHYVQWGRTDVRGFRRFQRSQ